MSARRKPRWLFIGPLPIERDVIGGTKVSFARLVESMETTPGIEVEVINTSRPRAERGPVGRVLADTLALVRVLLVTAWKLPRMNGMLFNVSSHGALRSAPLLWCIARLLRRPFAVRLFGGDFDEVLRAARPAVRRLAERTFLRAPLILLQTRKLCESFAHLPGVRWFPTTRELSITAKESARGPARRFLFVGQLRPEKGLAEALAASDTLPPGATLELFGPPMPGFDPTHVAAHEHARYGGALDRANVPSVLSEHDVLVFPSYHPGEGLPGVIIEAMQCGLPVIATRWRSIPELIEDGANGLLVEPRDAHGLGEALCRVANDTELYARLAKGARESGERYRDTSWSPRLADWLNAVDEPSLEAA